MPAKKGNKYAKGNNGGRPTKYKKEYAEQVYKLCLLGATDKEVADFFEVNEDTVNEWKKVHEEFSESLKEAKQKADTEIAKKLFERASGYEHIETKVFMHQGEVITHDVTKHYPPDVTAMIFWLKNRKSEKWKDKRNHEHTGKDGGPIEFSEYTDKEIDEELNGVEQATKD